MRIIKTHSCHNGRMVFYKHLSKALGCEMKFGIYLPPKAQRGELCPVLTYLAGLTCNEETFFMKGGAPKFASKHGIILISPDTSPRGIGLEGEDDDWDFGTGAGFYINATRGIWAENYKMEEYITRELQTCIGRIIDFDDSRQGIFGHSMGGHGALTLGLKYPDIFRSVSAFAPICSPSNCPWGVKAFGAYLGSDRTEWEKHDATCLIKSLDKSEYKSILVDQGLADEFLELELKPELLERVCEETGFPLTLRRHSDYDHSYYFVNTFMQDHIEFHAKFIC